MSEEHDIQKLLYKFIKNDCNEHEIKAIIAYVKHAKGTDDLPSFKEVMEQFEEIPDIEQDRAQDIYRNILKISKRKKQVSPTRSIWRYAAAAALVGILATSYFFRANFSNNDLENTAPTIVKTNIIPGTDKATLRLENGSTVFLKKGDAFHSENANSNGEEIIYKASKQNTTEIAYHYLTIPRGGQYFVKLSDGTQVWLNSESQLKYPVNFVEGETRKVELVYGEAYFDVSPSTEHKGTKFMVFNQSQEIEVLGTEFNIKAYKNEANIYTTLVEGKVDVRIENKKQGLIPNQQLNLDVNTNISIINSVDVYNEISWKEGVFSFEGKTLKEMMRVLSRWYDVDVIFKNKTIESEEFVGVLRKNQKIEGILNNIKNFGIIKNFKIEDGKIIID